MNDQADVLLVTVTKVESLAVLAAFEPAAGHKARLEPRGDKAYHDLGTVNGARVWLVRSELGSGGLGAAQQTVAKAIEEMRPAAVIMVGIAFGTRPASQAIGDVLVSQRLALYELQWVGTVAGGQRRAPFDDKPHGSTRLLDFLRAAELSWSSAAVHFGLILTGEKLVDNLEFRQQLCALESDAIGGEMEGAGLYTACHQAKVDWILVKGICDWADGSKETDRAARQALAAKNAAEFVVHMLEKVSLKGGGTAPPADHGPALAAYRQAVARSCATLPMRGRDIGASDPSAQQQQVELDQVYVNLDTTERVESKGEGKQQKDARLPLQEKEESRPLSALEAAAANRRLVLLGDPGSGKSTFLDHLCLCLARAGIEPAGPPRERLSAWPSAEADLLPIPVTLRDFVRAVGDNPPAPDVCTLWNFIAGRLREQKLEAAETPLLHALEQGRAMVLLDGLDEIPTTAQAQFVRAAVEAFANRYSRARFIITCRVLSYQNAAWQLRFKDDRDREQPCPSFTLAPFSAEKIDQFIGAWYADLNQLGVFTADEANTMAERLRKAIRREDLWRLAPNPLLLTVMALVHAHKGQLPDARALLYEDTVDLLLWRWEQLKRTGGSELPALRQLMQQANLSDVDLKRALWALAFASHQDGGTQDALADIAEAALERGLADLHPEGSLKWSKAMIATIKLRAGLLIERTGHSFTFPHRTFQEYLAGAHLGSLPDFATDAVELAGDMARWREVILLAVGRLVYLGGDVWKPLALVAGFCPEDADPSAAAWRKAWLAGEVLLEMGKQRASGNQQGRDLLKRVRLRLATLVAAEALAPVERAKAATVLGRLGDPRPGVGLNADGLPDIDWIQIPAGEFTMGSTKDLYNWAKETPQFQCKIITRPYRISRYPVTVAQFAAFVVDGGYRDDRWWPEAAAKKWRKSNPVTGPRDLPEVFETPNHPQVGISWFEAKAFCAWLAAKMNHPIRLPSEAEWERAARHTDARTYPWGENDPEQHANTGKTGIRSTSAVGIFPSGRAECGALDLSGNVWEWTRTPWMDDYQPETYQPLAGSDGTSACVVRGGSFNLPSVNARCAFRYWYHPDFRGGDLGFRVVASPF